MVEILRVYVLMSITSAISPSIEEIILEISFTAVVLARPDRDTGAYGETRKGFELFAM